MKQLNHLDEIVKNIDSSFTIQKIENLSGGCINQAVKIETNSNSFFLKYNRKSFYENFQAEVKNLEILRQTNTIQIPQVIKLGQNQKHSFLALELIQNHKPSCHSIRNLAEKLAELHSKVGSKSGLQYNNFIGTLIQDNQEKKDWSTFFIEKRLEPLLRKAIDNQLMDISVYKDFQYLFHHRIEELIIKEDNVLLHGDLWSGNVLYGEKTAYLIDPACYYGSREVDLAFSTLFGGFSSSFYEIYQTILPFSKGYQERFQFYNLYPLLVHLILFGSFYLESIRRILKKLNR